MPSHLEEIRKAELDVVLKWLPKPPLSILEIGAGAGWQARELSKLGFNVTAIDLADSHLNSTGIFEVTRYDGVNIPFADKTFDIVFSSNVLEHATEIDALLSEMRRVLKPGGFGIHVMPTPAWRFWTSASHYGAAVKYLFIGPRALYHWDGPDGGQSQSRKPQVWTIRKVLYASRHGEQGNVVTELKYFGRRQWLSVFARNGWTTRRDEPVGLFYTGYSVLDRYLSIPLRKTLSRVLGSACRLFLVVPEVG